MSLEKAFYPIRQPDGITCGPTCLVTLVRALRMLHGQKPLHVPGPMGRLSGYEDQIIEAGRRMGTCIAYGTRHIEMARGLLDYGLPVIRSIGGVPPENEVGDPAAHIRPDAWDVLSGTLRAGNAVLLRTLFYGAKHWVLLYADGDEIFMLEPSMGQRQKIDGDGDFITDCWARRGYDGFTVPLDCLPVDSFSGGSPAPDVLARP